MDKRYFLTVAYKNVYSSNSEVWVTFSAFMSKSILMEQYFCENIVSEQKFFWQYSHTFKLNEHLECEERQILRRIWISNEHQNQPCVRVSSKAPSSVPHSKNASQPQNRYSQPSARKIYCATILQRFQTQNEVRTFGRWKAQKL